jgi:16S rRNA processing protein RimM
LKSSNNPDLSGDLIQIGKVIGAHGIGGAVRVYSYTESADCFEPRKELVLIGPSGSQDRFGIMRSQAHKHVMRLMLEGVTTRNQAEALIGSDVFLAKKELPALEADTYYWSDVIGMAVHTVDGEYLGRIEQIIPTGANDVYVVKTPPDHALDEILLPAIATVVIDIDVEQRLMRVELPEGLV